MIFELQIMLRLKGKVRINVLIRPRLGDFVYNDYEFQIIITDILMAKEAGADGKYTYTIIFLCSIIIL